MTGNPRICVYHPTMGAVIAETIRAAYPDLPVDVVNDVRSDPPAADMIDVLIANTMPDGMLRRCTRLSWLHLTGSGTDHLAAAGSQPHLRVTTSANVPARAVAEFAWMAVLALAKDAPRLLDQQRRRQWLLPDARLVAGSRLLLLGLGRIGSAIAELAAPFGVRVTAVTRTAQPSLLVDTVLTPAHLVAAATETDYLISALPSTPDTRGILSRAVIGALPPHAAVVNVGRADAIDTVALVEALTAGRLRGAVLDVHDIEPLPSESPLWDVPGLWVTPHSAYRFPEEEHAVARTFLSEFTAWRHGAPPVSHGSQARCPVLAPAAGGDR